MAETKLEKALNRVMDGPDKFYCRTCNFTKPLEGSAMTANKCKMRRCADCLAKANKARQR